MRIKSGHYSWGQILVPLSISIRAILSIILLATVASMLVLSSVQNRKIALNEAITSYERLGEITDFEMAAVLGPVRMIVDDTSRNLKTLSRRSRISLETLKLFGSRLKDIPQLYSLYFGDRTGSFVMLQRTTGNPPANNDEPQVAYTGWTIERASANDFKQTVYSFDADLRVISKDTRFNNGYDPRTRTWYYMAKRSKTVIQTPPYVFYVTGTIGTTVAKRVGRRIGVVGGDISIEGISKSLEKHEATEKSLAVVYDDHGELLAADDTDLVVSRERMHDRPIIKRKTLATSGSPALVALSELHASGCKRGISSVKLADGTRWIVWQSPLKVSIGSGQNLAVMTPEDELFSAINDQLLKSVLIALVGLVLGLLCTRLLGRSIARPIQEVTANAEDITCFNLDEPSEVKSRIREVVHLASAQKKMRSSLRNFSRYAPEQLVRQLVTGNLRAEIGGVRQEASLLFTDIAGFTTLSEKTDPLELTKDVSDYFGILSATLMRYGGTIDKFIGDAVMVFWNAPVLQPDHQRMALTAALAGRLAVSRFNEKRMQQGKEPFFTRFGLHCGNPVIGNIGSSERLDYTALGSAVNLTSRLEGLNKRYGTEILISEQIKNRAGDSFLTRSVDFVLPKGAVTPVRVFELVGDIDGPEEIRPHSEQVEMVREWEAVYPLYSGQKWTEAADAFALFLERWPEDGIAKVLYEVVLENKKTPPSDDWDGVCVMKTK